MKKKTYHIEYDLPIEYDAHTLAVLEQLAGYMDYIMDDIMHDLGIERYQLQFYYMVNHIILDRIIKLDQRDGGNI